MISVTDLTLYHYCPRKFYLAKVLGIKDPLNGAMVKGAVRHKIYDLFATKEQSLIQSIHDPAHIRTRYVKEFSTAVRQVILSHRRNLLKFNISLIDAFESTWPHILTEIDTRTIHLLNTINKHKVVGEQLWEVLTPKIAAEHRITDHALQLRGIIDQIELYPSHRMPVELKTGKTPPSGLWPSHEIQIAAYMMMLEKEHKTPQGIVHYLDSSTKRAYVLNETMRSWIRNSAHNANTMMASSMLPNFCLDIKKCQNCGVREQCFNSAFIQAKMEAQDV